MTVTPSGRYYHPVGPYLGNIWHTIAIQVGDLHRRIGEIKAVVLRDCNTGGIILVAEVEPDSVVKTCAAGDALDDVNPLVEIQIRGSHIRFAEGRRRSHVLHRHHLLFAPGDLAQVAEVKDVANQGFVHQIRQAVPIHVGQVRFG